MWRHCGHLHPKIVKKEIRYFMCDVHIYFTCIGVNAMNYDYLRKISPTFFIFINIQKMPTHTHTHYEKLTHLFVLRTFFHCIICMHASARQQYHPPSVINSYLDNDIVYYSKWTRPKWEKNCVLCVLLPMHFSIFHFSCRFFYLHKSNFLSR